MGAASGGGGRQLTVLGGCTWRRGARGMVESIRGRPKRAVHGDSAAAQWGVKGRGRRKGAPRWGWAPFIAARGGGRRAAQHGGETGGGNQRPQLERRRHGLGANVQTVGLTRGPHAVLIFPIYPELAQFGNQKRMPYLTPKIPKFCMLLD
jgi:hypothetical protein